MRCAPRSCFSAAWGPPRIRAGGGLFSYSPEAYEKRRAERQDKLAQQERDQIAEEHQRQALNKQLEAKQQERASMQKKLADVRTESNKLRKQLDSLKAENEQQQKALADLKKRQEGLARDINSVNVGKGMTDDEKTVEAERLRREIERLADDTAALSAL